MHSASTPLADNWSALMGDMIDEWVMSIKGGKPHHPIVITGLSHTAKYVTVVPSQFIYICTSDEKYHRLVTLDLDNNAQGTFQVHNTHDCWESLHIDYTAGSSCGWVIELARSLQQLMKTGLAIDHITAWICFSLKPFIISNHTLKL